MVPFEVLDGVGPRIASKFESALALQDQRSNGLRQQVVTARIADDETRHAVLHRLVTAPGASGDLRHAGGGRLDEDDAEAFLFEPEPSAATVHDHEVAGTEPVRQH